MTKLLMLVLVGLVGCAGHPVAGTWYGHQVRRLHDDSLSVTCWTVLNEGAMTCLPDWFIRGKAPKE